MRAVIEAGCDVTQIYLPQRGIVGNSHALMAGTNSGEIAAIVIERLISWGVLS